MKIHLLFWFIADIAIWFGVYFISAKLHTERAKNENFVPQIKTLRICFIVSWIVVHSFLAYMSYQLIQWGGMD